MVITSELNKKKPPGGSSFAGHFSDSAFAASVFPGGDATGKTAFKTRLERREHQEFTAPPGAMTSASVEYTQYREPGRPSRLRRAYDEHARLAQSPTSSLRLKPSASSPVVGMTQEGWETHAGSVRFGSRSAGPGASASTGRSSSQASLPAVSSASMAAADTCADAQTAVSLKINTRWYPHTCANRGSLKLTQPKAMLMGVDPIKDKGHECPFWEADRHRFAAVSTLPGARPKTPPKSLRWRKEEAWNNPQNHFTMKVTQTMRSPGAAAKA
mmetsp:Transcript_67589/g.209087  ORF Transcript_67589/g.209087 Transcript_67589/m.209087 type:complete len:271 (+) Transcript_67589:72-884(+)